MADTIFNFDNPIKVKDGNITNSITHVDLSKIKDGLFFSSEEAFVITKGGLLEKKFIVEIVYDQEIDTLMQTFKLVSDVEEEMFAHVVLDKKLLDTIFRSVIEDEEYVFDIDFLKNNIETIKNRFKEKILSEKQMLIFNNEMIPCKYGKSGDGLIFNRLFFSKNNLLLCEAIYKDSKSIIDNTVIVYINDDITLEIEGTNNVGGSSTTASVPPISYIKVISRDDLFNIKIIDNATVDSKEFYDNELSLPKLDEKSFNELNVLINQLIAKNTEYDLLQTYKRNKSFFTQRIDILSYMLA